MCHTLLQDARLYSLLLRFDEELAAEARRNGCTRCGGRLDRGDFPRKPRGAAVLPDAYEWRFSFCCAERSCRLRHTPASVRFLGRRVYLGVVVALASALQQGTTPWRVSRLRQALGVSAQTLARWRMWWRETFIESAFWKAAKAALWSPVDASELPGSLLERFGGDELDQVVALMRFVRPLSTPAGYVPDRR